MEVLRVPPYPIKIEYKVPAAKALYKMFIQNTKDFSATATDVVSDLNNKVSYALLHSHTDFDAEYSVKIVNEDNVVVLEDSLTVVAPSEGGK